MGTEYEVLKDRKLSLVEGSMRFDLLKDVPESERETCYEVLLQDLTPEELLELGLKVLRVKLVPTLYRVVNDRGRELFTNCPSQARAYRNAGHQVTSYAVFEDDI